MIRDALHRLPAITLAGAAKFMGSVAAGAFACWLVININAGPGVIVTGSEEAEGPEFSDANTLDIVSEIRRNRVCPSTTQRWVWRWIDYKGRRAQQAYALAATEAPFLAEDGTFVLSVPAAGIPDPQHGGWKYRTVTIEQCGFLPAFVSQWFGRRMFRSQDMPVNFVGQPHEAAP